MNMRQDNAFSKLRTIPVVPNRAYTGRGMVAQGRDVVQRHSKRVDKFLVVAVPAVDGIRSLRMINRPRFLTLTPRPNYSNVPLRLQVLNGQN